MVDPHSEKRVSVHGDQPPVSITLPQRDETPHIVLIYAYLDFSFAQINGNLACASTDKAEFISS